MNFVRLKNPKSDVYLDFKNQVLSAQFDWVFSKTVHTQKNDNNYGEEYGECNMYSHPILARPDLQTLYPKQVSENLNKFNHIILEIFNYNKINWTDFSVMLRANVNAVHPQVGKVKYCFPHYDHRHPHKNLIIYLTDAGGRTFVEGEEYEPQEDDIVVFEGKHWHELPRQKRRVVLVMTYI